jgi:hypothetical protein
LTVGRSSDARGAARSKRHFALVRAGRLYATALVAKRSPRTAGACNPVVAEALTRPGFDGKCESTRAARRALTRQAGRPAGGLTAPGRLRRQRSFCSPICCCGCSTVRLVMRSSSATACNGADPPASSAAVLIFYLLARVSAAQEAPPEWHRRRERASQPAVRAQGAPDAGASCPPPSPTAFASPGAA